MMYVLIAAVSAFAGGFLAAGLLGFSVERKNSHGAKGRARPAPVIRRLPYKG